MSPRKIEALRRLVQGGVIYQVDHSALWMGTSFIWQRAEVGSMEKIHGATFHALQREGWIEEAPESNILHRRYRISQSGKDAALCWAVFKPQKKDYPR